MKRKLIYCCNCRCDVAARLTNGRETHPHLLERAHLPYWKCDTCKGAVGTHHKTSDPTRPLGVIASPAVNYERREIHRLMDPLWKSNRISRSELYERISKHLGIRDYHTAKIRNVHEAKLVKEAVLRIKSTLPV
ncbi:zinc-finger-containing protein [Vibrio mediterranei]|uniref:zinc-finger-containing protein n=1 Tax=Vibrio mediterranei TaxID=689 RepID=UPI0040679CB2